MSDLVDSQEDCEACDGLGQFDDATPCNDCGGSGFKEDMGVDEDE